jgi:membrane protein CcdC involved in cytochrome C biogenesis
MRHISFYYAIGFATIGFLIIGAYLSTFISMVSNDFDPYVTLVLATAMLLPFMIAMFSWRDWRKTQRNKNAEGESEHESA